MASRATSGIEVHESRFALIAPPDTNTSDEEDEGWVTTPRGKKEKKKQHQARINGTSSKPVMVSKTSVKNAKRRAKKKNNQQTTMANSSFQSWVEKDETVTDKAFEEDMKEALSRSLMDAKREEAEKLMEEEFIKASVSVQEQQQSASKKGVKMSLHEFLQSDAANPGATGTFLPQNNKTVSEPKLAVSTDSHFFSSIESEVKSELMKEKKRISQASNTGSKKEAGESARVAQLLNELEQKEATIGEQTLEIGKVQDEMKEVKFRNQVLCKMLSKGEFSTKQELLEQIEELTADKTELSQEIERLVSELEQERSKNKSLQIVISKLQQNKH